MHHLVTSVRNCLFNRMLILWIRKVWGIRGTLLVWKIQSKERVWCIITNNLNNEKFFNDKVFKLINIGFFILISITTSIALTNSLLINGNVLFRNDQLLSISCSILFVYIIFTCIYSVKKKLYDRQNDALPQIKESERRVYSERTALYIDSGITISFLVMYSVFWVHLCEWTEDGIIIYMSMRNWGGSWEYFYYHIYSAHSA